MKRKIFRVYLNFEESPRLMRSLQRRASVVHTRWSVWGRGKENIFNFKKINAGKSNENIINFVFRARSPKTLKKIYKKEACFQKTTSSVNTGSTGVSTPRFAVLSGS